MQPGLNYDKHDPKFILLGQVFKFIENENVKDIYSRYGITNRGMFVICLKIFFIGSVKNLTDGFSFFSQNISFCPV